MHMQEHCTSYKACENDLLGETVGSACSVQIQGDSNDANTYPRLLSLQCIMNNHSMVTKNVYIT